MRLHVEMLEGRSEGEEGKLRVAGKLFGIDSS
jgi:hypothetical protein